MNFRVKGSLWSLYAPYIYIWLIITMLALQSEGFRPVMVSRNRAGFTLNIIDTPGLVEGGYVSYQALDMIKRFVLLEPHMWFTQIPMKTLLLWFFILEFLY